MKKTIAFVSLLVLLVSTFAGAQNTYGTPGKYGITAWAVNNQRVASQYNYVFSSLDALPGGAASFTFPRSLCYRSFSGGRQVQGPSASDTITFTDAVVANAETLAQSAPTIVPGQCILAPTSAAHAHNSYIAHSGTCGLVPALLDLNGQGGEVIVDQKFYDDGCTAATITGTVVAAVGLANQYVHDISNGQDTWYTLKPTTLSLISAAGAALTLTTTAGSGSYYVNYEYIDAVGGIGLANTESTQATSAALPITTSAPAAATGAVGWIPMITASGGATTTEIEVPVTATVCTLAAKSTIKPACAIGATATIASQPSATSKELVESFGHTTFAYQPIATVPAFAQAGLGTPQISFGPFAAVTTIASAANSDVATFYLPAGAMNYLGKTIDVCFKANYSITSTGVPTWKLTAANQYAQSAVTLSTIVEITQAAAVSATGCFTVQTAATGATGTFWTSGSMIQTLNSSGAGTAATDVTTAASSAVDLTKGIYFSLNVGATTASVTALTVNGVTVRAVN